MQRSFRLEFFIVLVSLFYGQRVIALDCKEVLERTCKQDIVTDRMRCLKNQIDDARQCLNNQNSSINEVKDYRRQLTESLLAKSNDEITYQKHRIVDEATNVQNIIDIYLDFEQEIIETIYNGYSFKDVEVPGLRDLLRSFIKDYQGSEQSISAQIQKILKTPTPSRSEQIEDLLAQEWQLAEYYRNKALIQLQNAFNIKEFSKKTIADFSSQGLIDIFGFESEVLSMFDSIISIQKILYDIIAYAEKRPKQVQDYIYHGIKIQNIIDTQADFNESTMSRPNIIKIIDEGRSRASKSFITDLFQLILDVAQPAIEPDFYGQPYLTKYYDALQDLKTFDDTCTISPPKWQIEACAVLQKFSSQIPNNVQENVIDIFNKSLPSIPDEHLSEAQKQDWLNRITGSDFTYILGVWDQLLRSQQKNIHDKSTRDSAQIRRSRIEADFIASKDRSPTPHELADLMWSSVVDNVSYEDLYK